MINCVLELGAQPSGPNPMCDLQPLLSSSTCGMVRVNLYQGPGLQGGCVLPVLCLFGHEALQVIQAML